MNAMKSKFSWEAPQTLLTYQRTYESTELVTRLKVDQCDEICAASV